jgi:hypothetical protein
VTKSSKGYDGMKYSNANFLMQSTESILCSEAK